MKAEHEEMTFDRISTREELCEVIDLLCDTGDAIPAGTTRKRRQAGPAPSSAELLPVDLTFNLNDAGDEEPLDEADELTATLGGLFASPSWLN